MLKRVVVVALVVCSLNMACNTYGADTGALPFWEIGLSSVKADKPRAISVPGRPGALQYYWYWTFSFKAVPTIEKVKAFLEEAIPEMEGDSKTLSEDYLESINKTVDQEKTTRIFVSMLCDSGEVVSDLSNTVVRDLVERSTGKKYLTIAEASAKSLEPGEEIKCVAIFPRLDPGVRVFEIMLYGLGKRVAPHYNPGKLLYLQSHFNSSICRALRFKYRRIGGTAEDYLDPVQSEGKSAEWRWIWPAQVFMGRFRALDMSRSLDGDTKLQKLYWYVPYRIWNDTTKSQKLEVLAAGLSFPVKWRGESVNIAMLDNGEENDYWMTQAMRRIKGAVASGQELEFVNSNEAPAGQTEGDAAREDLSRKAKVLPDGKERHFAGELAAGKIARGLAVFEYGVGDVKALVGTLITELRAKAFAGVEGDEGSLLADIFSGKNAGSLSDQQVTEKIVAAAEKDLSEKGMTVTDADKREHGELAPVAVLLGALAREYAEAKAAKGLVNGELVVRANGMVEKCVFPSHFQRWLPKEITPVKDPEINLDISTQNIRVQLKKAEKTDAGGQEDEDDTEADEKKEEKSTTEELPW